jgi:hypothetical protein
MAAPAAEVDPRTSGPHLDLLCYFRSPKATLRKLRADWAEALGESPAAAVQRLADLGLLEPVALDSKLDRTQTVAELRAHLKARALPTSGNKPALVARLVAADETGAAALVSTFDAYDCTMAGEELARLRIDAVAELKAAAVEQSRSRIRAGDYAAAMDVACRFESSHKLQQHYPDLPFAIRDTRDPVEAMIAFATGRPKLFGKLPEETWEALRVAAAMDQLWGGWLMRWLPEGVERIGRFSASAAYVMLGAHAKNKADRAMAKRIGQSRATLSGAARCCAPCQAFADKAAPIDDLPELPNPVCVNEDGCRCVMRLQISFGE